MKYLWKFLYAGTAHIRSPREKGLVIFLLILPLIFSCSKTESTYTVETIDGVRYVHNLAPLWGDEPKITLEFVQKIGELEGTDENYQFYRPEWVAKDKTGNIYILDTGNYRIQVFSENGKYLKTFGKKGEGPGEFEAPVTLYFDSDGNLNVAEAIKGYVVVLSPDGVELRRFRLDHYHDFVRFGRSGRIVMETSPRKKIQAKNMAEETRIASLLDKDGTLLTDFGRLHDFGDRDITYYANGCDFAFDSSDNIYLSMYSQNRIEKYTADGEMIFRADRPLNFELQYEIGSQQIEGDDGETLIFSAPLFTGVSRGLAVDHKDRVWVRSYVKEKVGGRSTDDIAEYLEFQLFDTEGVWLGSVPVPENGVPVIIGDRLFLVDTYLEMAVYEYKIIEK